MSAALAHDVRGYAVDSVVAELADCPKSMAELVAKLGEGAREVVLAMESFGGIATHTTQDGVKFYGLSGGGACEDERNPAKTSGEGGA